jgi:hypothetical protein
MRLLPAQNTWRSPFSPEAVTEEYAKLIGPIKYPNLGIV